MAYAYEAITVADTAIGFTAANVATDRGDRKDPQKAICTLETAQIRFRIDGGDPTTTVGHVLNPGDVVEITGPADMINFRAIRTGSTSGSLKVSYE